MVPKGKSRMRLVRTGLFLIASAGIASPLAAGTLTLELLDAPSWGPIIDIKASGGAENTGYVLSLGDGRIRRFNRTGPVGSQTVSYDDFLGGVADPEFGQAFSIAFSPDYATDGHVYVSYVTQRVFRSDGTGFSDNTHKVVRYTRQADGTLNGSPVEDILSVAHATDSPANFAPHYGADIDFGPDGKLYVTTGDSDTAFTGVSVSQEPSDLRGKVLRLDPLNGNLVPEVVASGLRNPFKASFDEGNDRYFIADIGEDTTEELNLFVQGRDEGANYGWSVYEGDRAGGGQPLGGGVPDPLNYTLPLYQYDQDALPGVRSSITGGLSYYGSLAALDGQYLFGDYVRNSISSISSGLMAVDDGDVTSWDLVFDEGALAGLLTFGRDGAGGLFVSDVQARLYQITSATVPLPAGFALGLTSLAALGLMAARRRRPRL
jgi:hypothetical protein